jgi:hypothetical protein
MIELNQTYKVIEPFKTLCCSCVFEVGEILRPYKQPSKNRLWITQTKGWGHNVRRSNFERCTVKHKE